MITHNIKNLPFEMMLNQSDYDHPKGNNLISVSTLLKPLREIAITRFRNVDNYIARVDTSRRSQVAQVTGEALHERFENMWSHGKYRTTLDNMCIDLDVIDAIRVDPTEPSLGRGTYDVHRELRRNMIINGYTLSGKIDLIFFGRLIDYKKVNAAKARTKRGRVEYALQGSMYKMTHADLIHDDVMNVYEHVADWREYEQYQEGYPDFALQNLEIALYPVSEITDWVTHKLNRISELKFTPEDQLPACSPEELWMDNNGTWRYFAHVPRKDGKASKVFTSSAEALSHKSLKKGLGSIEHSPPIPKRCPFCSARFNCSQARQFAIRGLLVETDFMPPKSE